MEGTRNVWLCRTCGRVKDSVDPDGHVPVRRFCEAIDHQGRRVPMRRYLVALAPDPPQLDVERAS